MAAMPQRMRRRLQQLEDIMSGWGIEAAPDYGTEEE